MYDDSNQKELRSKRKYEKKGLNVPFSELGFKPKVYYTPTQSRPKKKFGFKNKVYQTEKSKENFLSRFTFILNVNQFSKSDAQQFKGVKRHQWLQLDQVILRTRTQVQCSICLGFDIIAPQITRCGHIFCWHCIFMHFEKSLRCSFCPVCNEALTEQDMKTCKIILDQPLIKQGKIKFHLRMQNNKNHRIFDPQTLTQDLKMSRNVRAKPQMILKVFEAENEQISEFYKSNTEKQYDLYLVKILSLSDTKISRFKQQNIDKKNKIGTDQFTDQHGFIKQKYNQKADHSLFYMQQNGRRIFLHPICNNYLLKSVESQQLPKKFQAEIIFHEQIFSAEQLRSKHYQYNNLPVTSEIDLVYLNISEFLSENVRQKFDKEVEKLLRKKEQEEQEENLEAERLRLRYQNQQKYIRQLQELAEKQYFIDISVPNMMTESDFSQQSFPTLNSSILTKEQVIQQVPTKIQKTQTQKQQQQKPKTPLINEDEFPDLSISSAPLKQIKSQQQTHSKGNKGKTKKKEKFTNVTNQFFCRQEQN